MRAHSTRVHVPLSEALKPSRLGTVSGNEIFAASGFHAESSAAATTPTGSKAANANAAQLKILTKLLRFIYIPLSTCFFAIVHKCNLYIHIELGITTVFAASLKNKSHLRESSPLISRQLISFIYICRR